MSFSPPPAPPNADSKSEESFVLTLPDDPASGNDWYLWAGVLALLVFIVFYPAINGQLLWDDDHHVGLMPQLQSAQGLADIWTPLKTTPQYYPMTYTTYWLEYQIWKDNWLGYHLDNFLLHAASAVLVWRLLRRLRLPGAWVAAAIWAIHPLQVESVCWMSERKNVLSGLLFFGAIWFYTEFAGLTPPANRPWPSLSADRSTILLGNRWLAYVVSFLLFAAALLAKSVTCAMPAIMLIILWWRGRKLRDSKTILPLTPFFAVGLAMSSLTVFLETSPSGNVAAEGRDWALTPLQRLLIAGRGVWFYAAKLVWPSHLTFSYPRIVPNPELLGGAMYAVQFAYIAAAVAAVAILWINRQKLGRGPLAAILCYGVLLFPALGFINIYPMRYSFVADHFQYLAGLALIVLVVGAAGKFIGGRAIGASVATAVSAAVLASLAVPAWLQAKVYATPIALWNDTIAKNPDSWMAYHNLGNELIRRGEQEQKAAADSLVLGDSDTAAVTAQAANDDYKQAQQLFLRSLQIYPNSFTSHTSLGMAYYLGGDLRNAEAEMRLAVDMDDQERPAHQLIAPYVDYAQLLERNHPGIDVRNLLDKALLLSNRPRTEPVEAANVHLAYGNYWFRQDARAATTGNSDTEVADLNRAIDELKLGLQTTPNNTASLIDLACCYQRMGILDQQKADQARAAGRFDESFALVKKSLEIDDNNAVNCYLNAAKQYPNGRFARALEGMGELYVRHIVDRDTQAQYIADLLSGLQFFSDALQIDTKVPGAARNLAAVSRQLVHEGQSDLLHESTWAPLLDRVRALGGSAVSKPDAVAADAAARDTLWPLATNHPLYQPLFDLRVAIRGYLFDGSAASAAKVVQRAAASVLNQWGQRNAASDSVADAISAATCFEGALQADAKSAVALQKLKETMALLDSAAAAHSPAPGLANALSQAHKSLDQYRAATRPAAP